MGTRSAKDVALAMEPTRSQETVARWARGETVPSALDIAPLAAALGVKAMLLIEPPAVPTYPLDEYLIRPDDAELHEVAEKATGRKSALRPVTPTVSPSSSPAEGPRSEGRRSA